MKIGFISDTHGDPVATQKALDALQGCDAILHLGDVLYHGPRNPLPPHYNPKELAALLKEREDILYIRGNCDSDVDEMVTEKDLSYKNRVITLGEVTIYAVHGYEESLEERICAARKAQAHILAFGHSHVKEAREKDGLWIVNPGSPTFPKDDGPSVAIYEEGKVRLIRL